MVLSLKPEAIDDILVFPDHADISQYYYLSVRPRLTWVKGEPQLRLAKYKGQATSGGLLTLGVNLGVTVAVLESVKDELQRRLGVRSRPALSPVPLVAGSVKLLLLNNTYDQHQPALYGDNQAVLSVGLTPEETTLIEQAMQTADFLPIGIVYDLDYIALRPAYSFRIQAQWDKVQRRLEEKLGIGLIFLKVEIDNVIETLVDERVIRVEIDTFVPKEEIGTDVLGDRARLLNDLQDLVISTFFEPKLSKIKPASGSPPLLGFSYRSVDTTQLDRRFLNIAFNEQTTVRRSLYPQANLGGLLKEAQDGGFNQADLVQLIDLDLPFFRKRRVQVISRANFEQDDILAINVSLRYGDDTRTLTLKSSTDRKDAEPWNLILAPAGTVQREVYIQYRVIFKTLDDTARPFELASDETVTLLDYVEISPRELYSILPIPITALRTFPWNRYKSVAIKTLYQDALNDIRLSPRFFLKANLVTQVWNMFVRDRTQQSFQYQLTYNATGSSPDIYQPWQIGSSQIIVRDPFPHKRMLTIVSLLSWTSLSEVYVDLSYQDTGSDISEQAHFFFDETDVEDKVFSVDLRDPKQQLITYSVFFAFKDNSVVQKIHQSVTLDKRLFLKEEMVGQQVVLLSVELIDFASAEIAAVVIEMQYAASIGRFKLASAEEEAFFKFSHTADLRPVYRYRTTYQFQNGFEGIVAWEDADAQVLKVSPRSLDSFILPPQPIEPRVLQVVVSTQDLDWQQVKSARVMLFYEDEDFEEKRKFFLRADDEPFQIWQVELKNDALKDYQWKVAFSMKDKSLGTRGKTYYPGPKAMDWEETDQSHILLKDYVST